jgi:hypothetical protein
VRERARGDVRNVDGGVLGGGGQQLPVVAEAQRPHLRRGGGAELLSHHTRVRPTHPTRAYESTINAGWTNELTLSEKLDRECEANFALRMELKKDEAVQVKNSQAMCSPWLESKHLNTLWKTTFLPRPNRTRIRQFNHALRCNRSHALSAPPTLNQIPRG